MFTLAEEQQLVLDTVRRMVKNEIEPLAKELDEQAAFPKHAMHLFAENGLLNALLPEKYGGSELPILTFIMVLEEISRVCASTALLLIAQADGMLPILHGGSEALKEKFLPRLAAGSTLLTAFAATEPSAGSDLAAMKTRAKKMGDVYVVNGRKCFITNGALADIMVLYAYTDPEKGSRGISAFVVEKGTPGLSYGKNESKMGMRGSVNSELFFDEMEIPACNLIGNEGEGLKNLLHTLSVNRLFCGAQAVGISQGALDQAIAFARERVQFGKPIAALAPIQFMVADMAAATESARLLCYQAAHHFDTGEFEQGALKGGMAKFTASDTAMRVTTDAVQIMGGYGYMKDFPVERMMRDAKLTQIYTGTNQITRLVAGRSLLKG